MSGLGLVVVLLLGEYSPYVRSKTNSHCLWWGEKAITFEQNTVGNSTTGPKAFDAVSTSFATWQVAMNQCSGLKLVEGAKTTSRKIGVESGDGKVNANVVLFRASSCKKKVNASDACWADGTCGNKYDCWGHASALLGITTVSFNTSSGRMFDADIELNAADNVFTAVDSPVCTGLQSQRCVATDVQNTVTHEIGHLLGLDHTKLNGSTMSSTASMGETSKRTIDQGTRSFVCDVYEKDMPPLDCVLSPATAELGEVAKGGCSAASTGVPMMVLALMVLLRRKRAVAVVLALVATGAQASTLEALSVDQLISTSDAVVHARVGRVSARWSADHSKILTDVELEVTEVWKGLAVAPRITVMQPGGVVGEVGQLVEGTPTFRAGEEVVLFLESAGPRFVVTGFSQGKFEVGNGWVRQAASDVHLVDAWSGAVVTPALESMPIDQLKRWVVGTVKEVFSPVLLVP